MGHSWLRLILFYLYFFGELVLCLGAATSDFVFFYFIFNFWTLLA